MGAYERLITLAMISRTRLDSVENRADRGQGRGLYAGQLGRQTPPMRSTGSAVPIVQPVHRAWGKLSEDLSETTRKSNKGTDQWQSGGGLKASCRGRRE